MGWLFDWFGWFGWLVAWLFGCFVAWLFRWVVGWVVRLGWVRLDAQGAVGVLSGVVVGCGGSSCVSGVGLCLYLSEWEEQGWGVGAEESISNATTGIPWPGLMG